MELSTLLKNNINPTEPPLKFVNIEKSKMKKFSPIELKQVYMYLVSKVSVISPLTHLIEWQCYT